MRNDSQKRMGLIHKEMIRKELIHKELIHKELIHKELIHKELIHKELIHKELIRKELIRKELIRKELIRKEQRTKNNEMSNTRAARTGEAAVRDGKGCGWFTRQVSGHEFTRAVKALMDWPLGPAAFACGNRLSRRGNFPDHCTTLLSLDYC
jgi:hypothetical protein